MSPARPRSSASAPRTSGSTIIVREASKVHRIRPFVSAGGMRCCRATANAPSSRQRRERMRFARFRRIIGAEMRAAAFLSLQRRGTAIISATAAGSPLAPCDARQRRQLRDRRAQSVRVAQHAGGLRQDRPHAALGSAAGGASPDRARRGEARGRRRRDAARRRRVRKPPLPKRVAGQSVGAVQARATPPRRRPTGRRSSCAPSASTAMPPMW